MIAQAICKVALWEESKEILDQTCSKIGGLQVVQTTLSGDQALEDV